MIVDIVELPSRLRYVKRKNELIASEMPVGLPMPSLARITGYWEPCDEPWTFIGGVHPVITDKDALFRYKFMEPTKYGLAEYFVMTASPIDILNPNRTPRVKLVCPWVSLVDPKTFRVRKFILWSGIFELMHYETEDTIIDVPAEAVLVNELRNLAILHDRPDLLALLDRYPSDYKNVLISEEKIDGDVPLDNLLTLKANMEAYNSMCANDEPYYWCDIMDVLRDVDIPNIQTNTVPLTGCSFLTHVIHGPVTISEIRHLFGMTYDTHAYQRNFNLSRLRPDTELSIREDDKTAKFDILKYVERLPYSEFELTIDGPSETGTLKLFNPYDPSMKLTIDKSSLDPDVTELINKIVKTSLSDCPGAAKITIIRSMSEEVYITTVMEDESKTCSYYDLVSASLGSRTLIRDYSGSF